MSKYVLLILLFMGFIYSDSYFNSDSRDQTAEAVKQLNSDVDGQTVRQNVMVRSNGWLLGYFIFAGTGAMMALRDMSGKIKLLMLMPLLLICSGCWKPYPPVKLEAIGTNEEAFLIPYTGDGSQQTSSNNEEFLSKNMVYTKQVQIPQQWIQRGYKAWIGEYQDSAILIKVDKSPVTREWTADENSGTSNRNEAIWVMTSDQVEFSTGWTITARIQSRDDAVKFLHNYPNGTLTSVLDGEVRAKIQALFGIEVTDLPMDELRKGATPHIEKVVSESREFFEKRGITITNLGITGGFVYKNPTIMQTMVDIFNAEQQKTRRIADFQAQEEQNKQISSAAEGQAKALLKQKQAEADGIKMVADAKAYEIKQATQDSKAYLSLKQLEIERARIEKWDGKYPNWFMSGGGNTPSLLMQAPEVK